MTSAVSLTPPRSKAEIYFATNDFAEAKNVANEAGFDFLVVRGSPDVADFELVYDASFNTELPLDFK